MHGGGGWSEIWKSGSISNRWGATRHLRHGSFAPLLHSPGGRLACIASPPSHLPPVGTCFGTCCPYCPGKCTCRSAERSFRPGVPHFSCDVVQTWLNGGSILEKIECILTLYRREYSRAHITSSRTTRCRDTSSPVRVLEDIKWNLFVIDSWLVQSRRTHPLWIHLRCRHINFVSCV